MTNLDDFTERARQTIIRGTNLSEYKHLESAQNIPIDSEMMVEMISNEVGSWKKGLLDDYKKIADRAEKDLKAVEDEKKHLIADKSVFLHQLNTLRQELKHSRDDNLNMKRDLTRTLDAHQSISLDYNSLKEKLIKLESLHTNVEKSLRTKINLLTEESEKKINELSTSVQKLTKEKNAILVENKNISQNYNDTDDFLKHQSEQLAELTIKNSKLYLENDSLRSKINEITKENSKLLDENTSLKDETINLKSEIDKITNEARGFKSALESKIREEAALKKTVESVDKEPGRKDTNLVRFDELNFPDSPDYYNQLDQKALSEYRASIYDEYMYKPRSDSQDFMSDQNNQYIPIANQDSNGVEGATRADESRENKSDSLNDLEKYLQDDDDFSRSNTDLNFLVN